MKLISFDKNNSKYIKYPHVKKTLEGFSYTLKCYPPVEHPKLNQYQQKDLMEALLWEAKERGMYIRHT